MAILGGNINLVRWLLSERYCPLKKEIKNKGKTGKTVSIVTSKGRTPLRCAIHQEHYDVLKYLLSKHDISLFDEDLKSDYKHVLIHLTRSLQIAPFEHCTKRGKEDLEEAKVTLATQPISPVLI
jgi:hypothetical protein